MRRLNTDLSRVLKKSRTIPDVIEFYDEDGDLIHEFGELTIDPEDKFIIAAMMIDQRQSLDTIVSRMISLGLRLRNKND